MLWKCVFLNMDSNTNTLPMDKQIDYEFVYF